MNPDRIEACPKHMLTAGSPHRIVALLLAAITLASLCALLIWDIYPGLFPPNAHALLGASPLAMIAFAWLAHNAAQHGSPRDRLKASLLAVAFLFWATNQCLRDAHAATVCNDIAIALFVLDLLWIIRAPAARKQRTTDNAGLSAFKAESTLTAPPCCPCKLSTRDSPPNQNCIYPSDPL